MVLEVLSEEKKDKMGLELGFYRSNSERTICAAGILGLRSAGRSLVKGTCLNTVTKATSAQSDSPMPAYITVPDARKNYWRAPLVRNRQYLTVSAKPRQKDRPLVLAEKSKFGIASSP